MHIKKSKLKIIICLLVISVIILLIMLCKNLIPQTNENILNVMQDGMTDAAITNFYKEEIKAVEELTNADITIYCYTVDLNGDKQEDKIIYLRSPLHSGSHGDTVEIVMQENGEYRKVMTGIYRLFPQDEAGKSLGAIHILTDRSEGVSDIEIITDGKQFVLEYRDGRYQPEPNKNHATEEPEQCSMDLNGNGVDELIQIENNRIVAIYADGDKENPILEDLNDSTEYYFLGKEGNLIYYTQYFGMYRTVRFENYIFDKNWNKKLLYALSVYDIYDISQMPDEWERTDMQENGIYYRKDAGNEWEQEALTGEEFGVLYEQMTGHAFDLSCME